MTNNQLIKAHEKDLRRVLEVSDKHSMVCKPTKASLFVREVEFAANVVGHGQRRPMPGKLAVLHHWEKPQTISELRSFVGFCNYFSGYVRMYAELSGPIHRMLQVGRFDVRKGSKKQLLLTTEAEEAFDNWKKQLLGALGLFLVDPDKGFVLRTDASDYAVRAVLEQVRCDGTHVPVCFWSQVLAEGQRRMWYAVEREGKGDLCHRVCAPEMVGPHQTSTRAGMYGSSITSALAQGACGYPLGSSDKASPMAQDMCEIHTFSVSISLRLQRFCNAGTWASPHKLQPQITTTSPRSAPMPAADSTATSRLCDPELTVHNINQPLVRLGPAWSFHSRSTATTTFPAAGTFSTGAFSSCPTTRQQLAAPFPRLLF